MGVRIYKGCLETVYLTKKPTQLTGEEDAFSMQNVNLLRNKVGILG